MSTAELKTKLIQEIKASTDENLLLEVSRLFGIEQEVATEYPLSEEQITVVREAQEQVRKGKYLRNAEAEKEIDEWLGK
jgi:predicted house-cleaning noncanonical NTP pyrophosphatase (MazG superfamily)